MSSARSRTWTDGLDNLGENLIRLSTALKSVEESAGSSATDASYVAGTGQLGERFGLAFRQAHPVLVSGEKAFLDLVPSGPAASLPSPTGDENPQQAHTLVHEAILASQEIVSLLERMARAGALDAAITRKILQSSLHQFAETTASVGWELKAVCHEYLAEVSLLGGAPATIEDLGPGAAGIVNDMAGAARRLRAARREWFRTDHRLAAATAAGRT